MKAIAMLLRHFIMSTMTVASVCHDSPAQLVFDDGAEHVLSDLTLNEPLVQVTNGSRLITHEVIMDRGCIVQVTDGDFQMHGGRVLGALELTQGSATVEGSIVWSPDWFDSQYGRDLGTAIRAMAASVVTVRHAGVVDGIGHTDGTGIELKDHARLNLEGGTVQGRTGIDAGGATSATMTGGTIVTDEGDGNGTGPAIFLRDDAVFRVDGGAMASDNGGVETQGRSLFQMFGGTLHVGDSDYVRSGISTGEQSQVIVRGARIDVDANMSGGPIIVSAGESAVSIESGELEWANYLPNDPSDNYFIAAKDAARVAIEDGTFVAQIWESGSPTGGLFRVEDSAHVNIDGGAFTFAQGGYTGDVRPLAGIVTANAQAVVEIRGGTFAFEQTWFDPEAGDYVQVDQVDHLQAADEASITIYGRDFNHPLGIVTALDGTITGTLADGKPIQWHFRRDETAKIMLVPEPSGNLVWAIVTILLARLRPKRA